MGVHSGKYGVVDNQSTVRTWSITDTMAPQSYVASNTRLGTGRQPGVHDFNGNFAYYGHTPPAMPGEEFDFAGYTAPDDDVSGNGIRYDGPSIVENVQMNWNWTGGEILNGVVNFQGNGALVAAVGAQLEDLTVPIVPPVADTKIQYSVDGGANWLDWDNVAQAALTISATLHTVINSSTVDSGKVWTQRRAGPIDWTCAITEQDTIRSKFQKGDSIMLRLFVSATEFWELKWGLVNEFTGLTVDRQTGAIMQQTVNLGMNGFDPDAGSYAAAAGHIILPDTTTWWPFDAAPTTTV